MLTHLKISKDLRLPLEAIGQTNLSHSFVNWRGTSTELLFRHRHKSGKSSTGSSPAPSHRSPPDNPIHIPLDGVNQLVPLPFNSSRHFHLPKVWTATASFSTSPSSCLWRWWLRACRRAGSLFTALWSARNQVLILIQNSIDGGQLWAGLNLILLEWKLKAFWNLFIAT